MINARDELVDVIAEALRADSTHYNSRLHSDHIAEMALNALAEKYGEPVIEERELFAPVGGLMISGVRSSNKEDMLTQHRLGFPWRTVKEDN